MLVSIWMLTFNHEKYLHQSLESVLMQKRNFDLEIVIGDDFSRDETRKIISAYQLKYPQIIKPILRKYNIGIAKNFEDTWFKCKGKYIALLEGDDYWTDPFKLQKQVNFLEGNTEYVASYTKAKEINELTNQVKITNEDDPESATIERILSRGWFMRTGSIVCRNNLFHEFPDFFYRYGSTDYILHILLAQHGPIKFINEVTNVYRRHEGGITQEFQSRQIDFNLKKEKLLSEIDAYFNYHYSQEIKQLKRKLYTQNTIIALNQLKNKQINKNTFFYFLKSEKLQVLRRFVGKLA